MRKRTIIFGVIFLILALPVAAQEKPATQDFKFTANQSVYVIAVKSAAPRDATTWLMLRRNLPNVQAVTRNPAPNNSSDRTTLEKLLAERSTLERDVPIRRLLPPVEPELQKLVEQEFLKQKKFKLADSPETADFVFFAHGEYVYAMFASNSRGGGSGFTTFSSRQSDNSMELNTLAKLSVAAIPASDYRQWQSDVPHLFEKAKWRDELWGEIRQDSQRIYEEPSAKKLAQQFHKQALKK